MDVISLVLGIIGVAGTIGTFYYGFKSLRLTREKHRFSWEDVASGCRALAQKAIKRWKPECVVFFCGPSGIVANLMIQYADHFVPCHMIVIDKARFRGSKPGFEIVGHKRIETTKWYLHVPDALMTSGSGRKVLVIDDVAISGDSLLLIKNVLVDAGLQREQIRTCALVCTQIAKNTNKAPDFHYYMVGGSDFYLPWGQGY
jgi:hypoxanthine phosphoribosyltransferase